MREAREFRLIFHILTIINAPELVWESSAFGKARGSKLVIYARADLCGTFPGLGNLSVRNFRVCVGVWVFGRPQP